MRYRQLGSTGLEISQVILGCGNFGGTGSTPTLWGSGSGRDEAFRVMDAAFDLGIICFDTADSYGGGLSERFIGEWLRTKSAAVRDQILISTKVGQPVGQAATDRGLSARHIARQIDRSLTRLGVDSVAMYLIHHPDPSTPMVETMSALDTVAAAGKVRHLGACNMTPEQIHDMAWVSERNGLRSFEWIQNPYNLIQRDDEKSLFERIAARGLGYTPHSPLAGGWLTGKYRKIDSFPADSRMARRPGRYESFVTESLPARIDELRRHSELRGCSLPALALAWLLSNPHVTAPIVGPRRPEHLDVVAEALTLTLSVDECRELADVMARGTAEGPQRMEVE